MTEAQVFQWQHHDMSNVVCSVQQALRERFGIPANNAHRALDDCQVLQKIVPHLLRLNETPDFSTLMSRKNSKCSGTFEDILGAGAVFYLYAN